MEELWWNERGELRTHAPSTYKIPTAHDVPARFRIDFFGEPNREETIYRSKAVGEPPFMLALSAFHALRDAVASVAGRTCSVQLDAPATDERILFAVEDVRLRARANV
jgi:xanthine dehydrogenase large subunit